VRTLLAAALLVVAFPGVLRAEIVRWTDERGITHYSEGLDTVPERYRAGAEPLGIRNRPTTPGTDRPVIRPEGEIIRFTPGRHIYIDVRINDSVSARLVPRHGRGADDDQPAHPRRRRVPFGQGRTVRRRGIADGVYVDAVRVPVQSLTVGNARVERMAVNAYDMGARDMEGLLGQDFLGHFNVSIDPALGIVTLKPR
jgi:hypothetical protein